MECGAWLVLQISFRIIRPILKQCNGTGGDRRLRQLYGTVGRSCDGFQHDRRWWKIRRDHDGRPGTFRSKHCGIPTVQWYQRLQLTILATGRNDIRRCRLQQYVQTTSNSPNPNDKPVHNRTTPANKADSGNWLGGEAVYDSLLTPGSPTPGYINLTTADNLVHGQAKQSGLFTFVRVYDAGHEVPYYQPLTALNIFERVINRYDVATGQTMVGPDFVSVGEAKSTYREGNASVIFPPGAAASEGGGGSVETYSSEEADDQQPPAKSWNGIRPPARVLATLGDDGLRLVTPNATSVNNATVLPHGSGNGGGLIDPELKLKIKEMVHITHHRRRKRRGWLVDSWFLENVIFGHRMR